MLPFSACPLLCVAPCLCVCVCVCVHARVCVCSCVCLFFFPVMFPCSLHCLCMGAYQCMCQCMNHTLALGCIDWLCTHSGLICCWSMHCAPPLLCVVCCFVVSLFVVCCLVLCWPKCKRTRVGSVFVHVSGIWGCHFAVWPCVL